MFYKACILIGEVNQYLWHESYNHTTCTYNPMSQSTVLRIPNGNIHCAWEFKGGTTNIFGETEEGFNKGHTIWIGDIE